MRLSASAALLGMAFNAMAVSNEETVVPLHAQINKPCLSLRTDDFSRITLPAEALRVLADNRPAPPPNWQWLSEEDRLAYIAGNQARTLLVAARTAATAPEGCRELDLSVVPFDAHYLVAKMLESGEAAVTINGASSPTIRIIKTDTQCERSFGIAKYFAADGTYLFFLTTCRRHHW
jgi:hypothetical protein